MVGFLLVLVSCYRMGIFFCLLRECCTFGGSVLCVFPRSRVMLMRVWLGVVWFVSRISGKTNTADEAADFGRRGLIFQLLRLVAVNLELHRFVIAGDLR